MRFFDKFGKDLLYYALKKNNYDIVKFLLDLNMNPNRICDKKSRNTPLHMAFNTGNIYIVMFLIKRGANLNTLNKMGHTPLAFDKGNLLHKLNLTNGITNSSSRKSTTIQN